MCKAQYELVEKFLLELLKIAKAKDREILNISCCVKDISRFTSRDGLYFLKDSPDIKAEIQKESSAEAGNGTCPNSINHLANREARDDSVFQGIKTEIQEECKAEAGNIAVNGTRTMILTISS
jgi:hypothetical protein